ncbi:MAG TPA: hypothetical protein VKG25_09565 [Bryobacteraceae bacterium]|nr:hypothetical protein [Bryobacteraceae bacterium]
MNCFTFIAATPALPPLNAAGRPASPFLNYLAGLFILKNSVCCDGVIGQLHFVDSQGLDRSTLSGYVQNSDGRNATRHRVCPRPTWFFRR